MWISRDCGIDLSSMMNPFDRSDQQQAVVASPAWAAASAWDSSVEGIAPWEGEYEKAFETLKQIGKGAFGHVNLAKRREDQLVVKLLNIYSVRQLILVSERLWSNSYAKALFYKIAGLRIKNLAVCHLRLVS